MDIKKVGMYGHSGGGYSTANALLKYPPWKGDQRIYDAT